MNQKTLLLRSNLPLRVALIANSSIPGGAESYLYRLYEGLTKQGLVDVTLIGELPDWPKRLKSLPIGRAPKLTRREPILPQLKGAMVNARAVRQALKSGSYDLVHMQYFREKLVLPGYFTRQIPVLWTEHGPLPPNFPAAGLPWLRHQAKKSTIIAVSHAVHESLSEKGLASSIVWNPLPSMNPAGMNRQSGRESNYVLYAGRIHENKRLDLLLDTARITPSVMFKVAGEGPALAALQRKAPPNVEFLGHLGNLRGLMEGCLAVVATSGRAAREGSPMVVLEARNMAVPVLVANDSHAAKEAMGLGAHLYEPEPNELADLITGLGFATQLDPLSDSQSIFRGEDRWLRETYNVMTSMVRPSRAG